MMKPTPPISAAPAKPLKPPADNLGSPSRDLWLPAIGFDRLTAEFSEAFARLSAETIPVYESLGRVLREDVRSATPLPPYSRSVVDGYAVRTVDVESAAPSKPVFLTLKGCVAAGDDCFYALNPGEAVKLTSGSRIPAGADRAIPEELTFRQNDRIRVDRVPRLNRLIIEKGEDAAANQILLRRGIRIGPVTMGTLAACGRQAVAVSRRPIIGIVSTGSELTNQDSGELSGFQAFDVNGPLLAGLSRQAGADASFIGLCPDRSESFKRLFETAGRFDIVVITGGTADGDFDLMEKNMLAIGGSIRFRLQTGSGRRVLVARKNHQILVGLPGNPLAALTNFFAVVRPLLYAQMGRNGKVMNAGMARNAENRLLKPDHDHLLPAKLETRQGQTWVRLFAGSKSSRLSTLMAVDALVHIKHGTRQLKRGELVAILRINPGHLR